MSADLDKVTPPVIVNPSPLPDQLAAGMRTAAVLLGGVSAIRLRWCSFRALQRRRLDEGRLDRHRDPGALREEVSGAGRVTLTAPCSEPGTGREVLRLETDWTGDRRSAVYILPQEPAPAVGELIEWTTARVIWHRAAGAPVQLRKIGYAFDPYPRFSDSMQQV